MKPFHVYIAVVVTMVYIFLGGLQFVNIECPYISEKSVLSPLQGIF